MGRGAHVDGGRPEQAEGTPGCPNAPPGGHEPRTLCQQAVIGQLDAPVLQRGCERHGSWGALGCAGAGCVWRPRGLSRRASRWCARSATLAFVLRLTLPQKYAAVCARRECAGWGALGRFGTKVAAGGELQPLRRWGHGPHGPRQGIRISQRCLLARDTRGITPQSPSPVTERASAARRRARRQPRLPGSPRRCPAVEPPTSLVSPTHPILVVS